MLRSKCKQSICTRTIFISLVSCLLNYRLDRYFCLTKTNSQLDPSSQLQLQFEEKRECIRVHGHSEVYD